jgi:hypothetical protein
VTVCTGAGGADDGYAAFASVLAIEAAQTGGLSHNRCVVLIEASEESGSPDLPAYLEALAEQIGSPSLVLCLDSGCLDYERWWVTTSLRGLVGGTLRVDILTEGVHSGEASGIVPSSFGSAESSSTASRTASTAGCCCPELLVEIPDDRREQAAADPRPSSRSASTSRSSRGRCRWSPTSPNNCSLERWYPALSVTGVDGIPPVESAGNVLRPGTPPCTSASVSHRRAITKRHARRCAPR